MSFAENAELQSISKDIMPYSTPDKERGRCPKCNAKFQMTITRRHHCRCCGDIYCGKCSSQKCMLDFSGSEYQKPVRVCDYCYEHLSQNDKNSLLRYFIILRTEATDSNHKISALTALLKSLKYLQKPYAALQDLRARLTDEVTYKCIVDLLDPKYPAQIRSLSLDMLPVVFDKLGSTFSTEVFLKIPGATKVYVECLVDLSVQQVATNSLFAVCELAEADYAPENSSWLTIFHNGNFNLFNTITFQALNSPDLAITSKLLSILTKLSNTTIEVLSALIESSFLALLPQLFSRPDKDLQYQAICTTNLVIKRVLANSRRELSLESILSKLVLSSAVEHLIAILEKEMVQSSCLSPISIELLCSLSMVTDGRERIQKSGVPCSLIEHVVKLKMFKDESANALIIACFSLGINMLQECDNIGVHIKTTAYFSLGFDIICCGQFPHLVIEKVASYIRLTAIYPLYAEYIEKHNLFEVLVTQLINSSFTDSFAAMDLLAYTLYHMNVRGYSDKANLLSKVFRSGLFGVDALTIKKSLFEYSSSPLNAVSVLRLLHVITCYKDEESVSIWVQPLESLDIIGDTERIISSNAFEQSYFQYALLLTSSLCGGSSYYPWECPAYKEFRRQQVSFTPLSVSGVDVEGDVEHTIEVWIKSAQERIDSRLSGRKKCFQMLSRLTEKVRSSEIVDIILQHVLSDRSAVGLTNAQSSLHAVRLLEILSATDGDFCRVHLKDSLSFSFLVNLESMIKDDISIVSFLEGLLVFLQVISEFKPEVNSAIHKLASLAHSNFPLIKIKALQIFEVCAKTPQYREAIVKSPLSIKDLLAVQKNILHDDIDSAHIAQISLKVLIFLSADAQHAEHFLDVDIFSSVLPLLFDNFQKTPIAKLQATKEKYLTREKSSSLTRLSAIFLAIITSDPSTRLRISSTCEHRRLVPAAYDYLRSWWDLASKGPDDLAFKRSVTDEVDTPADTVDDEINEVMPIIDMLYNLSCFSDDSLRLEPSDCGDKVVKLLISICKICRDGDDRKSKVLIVLAKIGSDLEGANGSSGGLPWSVLVTGSHVDICLDLICLVPFSSKKWSFDESSLLLTKAASCATVRRLISAVTESSSNLKENSFIFEQIDLFCTKRRLLHAIEMISKSFGQAAWCFADIISLPFIRFQHTSPSLPYTILDLLQSDDSSSPWKVRTAVALLSAAVQKAGIGSDRESGNSQLLSLLSFLKCKAVSGILEGIVSDSIGQLKLLLLRTGTGRERKAILGTAIIDSIFVPLPEPSLSQLLVDALFCFTIFFDDSIPFFKEVGVVSDTSGNKSQPQRIDLTSINVACNGFSSLLADRLPMRSRQTASDSFFSATQQTLLPLDAETKSIWRSFRKVASIKQCSKVMLETPTTMQTLFDYLSLHENHSRLPTLNSKDKISHNDSFEDLESVVEILLDIGTFFGHDLTKLLLASNSTCNALGCMASLLVHKRGGAKLMTLVHRLCSIDIDVCTEIVKCDGFVVSICSCICDSLKPLELLSKQGVNSRAEFEFSDRVKEIAALATICRSPVASAVLLDTSTEMLIVLCSILSNHNRSVPPCFAYAALSLLSKAAMAVYSNTRMSEVTASIIIPACAITVLHTSDLNIANLALNVVLTLAPNASARQSLLDPVTAMTIVISLQRFQPRAKAYSTANVPHQQIISCNKLLRIIEYIVNSPNGQALVASSAFRIIFGFFVETPRNALWYPCILRSADILQILALEPASSAEFSKVLKCHGYRRPATMSSHVLTDVLGCTNLYLQPEQAPPILPEDFSPCEFQVDSKNDPIIMAFTDHLRTKNDDNTWFNFGTAVDIRSFSSDDIAVVSAGESSEPDMEDSTNILPDTTAKQMLLNFILAELDIGI